MKIEINILYLLMNLVLFQENLLNEQIIARFNSCAFDKNMNCKNDSYKFWYFNCEDFVCYVCDCNIGRDQRMYYFGTSAVVILLAIVATTTYLIVRKK